MIAHTEWKGESLFEGHSQSRHTVLFDTSAEHAQGPSPMEAVLMGLCGCTSVDVVEILRKKRQPVTSLRVSATAEQAEEPPRVFTRILLTYRVGGAVTHKAMEDAVALSKNKYCSVSNMLNKTAEVEFRIEYADEEARA